MVGLGACVPRPLLASLICIGLACGTDGVPRDAGVDAAGLDALHDLTSIEYIEPACGNGQVDPGEGCDDGNHAEGDGCNSLCQIECSWKCGTCGVTQPCIISSVCGDGIRTSDEACDDGNTTSGDGCAADCAQVEPGWACLVPGTHCTPVCGDGLMVGAETCDDGNTVGGDGCSPFCLVEPTALFCGDGIVSGAEQCDDGPGNGTVGDACDTGCRTSRICGDGVVEGTEECDLGSLQNTASYGQVGCTLDCRRPPSCGDGIVDTDFGEACDLGAYNGRPDTLCTDRCEIVLI